MVEPLSDYRKKVIVISIVLLTVSILIVNIPSTKAQFVIAGWDYDDGYGQGIEVLWFHENSTGSWVAIFDPAFVFWYEETVFELNATPDTALKIIVGCRINHTLFDFGPDKSENASARAIMRTSIEVTNIGKTVFSQQNLTWDGTCFDDTATTWSISYEVVINVLLVAGQTYRAVITYEIYGL